MQFIGRFPLYSFDTVTSTNDKLKELLNKKELDEFTVVKAAMQTAGKGQTGNRWESEKGKNLTVSILLKPTFLDPGIQFYISKIASLAILNTLNKYGIKALIKWPNDIYVDGKKIAGILIENSIMGTGLAESIVGIGLNINQKEFSSNVKNPVSMIHILQKETDTDKILHELQDMLHRFYKLLQDNKFEDIDHAYFDALYRRHTVSRFKDINGEFTAEILSVEPTGFLILKDTSGIIRKYAFKEVEFL